MSRFLSSSQEALSQLDRFCFRQLVDVGVTSGTLYVCSGYRYLYCNGNTYTPTGILGGIDPIQEESDPFPRGIKLWLAAVNSSQMYEPLREDMFNRPVKVWEAWLDPDTFAVPNTAEVAWAGWVNEVELVFNDSERGTHAEITSETELRRVPRRAYFNKETIVQVASDDTFYDYMHLIPTFKSMWGQQATQYVTGVHVPGGHWAPGPGHRYPVWVPD